MSEIIDSLCGATASCDTLVVKVVKAADVVCQPIIKEAETSCNDVMIVGIICVAIVLVAIVAVFGFLYWKNMEIKADREEREFQKTKEKEADIAARKQKADAQGKLLDFLKEKVSSFDMQKKEYEKACGRKASQGGGSKNE